MTRNIIYTMFQTTQPSRMDLDTLKNDFYSIIIYKMYSDYKTLTAHGIDVFSVKTDAFTIKEADYETAQSCLCFQRNWRLEMSKKRRN